MRQDSKRLSESDLRDALKAHLQGQMSPHAQLVEELGIEHGGARIDVAVIDQALTGFEIKSDFDTLDRLANQMHAYHRVFDSLTLVTTADFVSQVDQLLPPWWGIWQAAWSESEGVSLTSVRAATGNPRQEAHSILSLLWRDEALSLLRTHSTEKINAHASRAKHYEQLAGLADLHTLRDWVTAMLRARTTWREQPIAAVKSVDPVAAPFVSDDGWQRLVATS